MKEEKTEVPALTAKETLIYSWLLHEGRNGETLADIKRKTIIDIKKAKEDLKNFFSIYEVVTIVDYGFEILQKRIPSKYLNEPDPTLDFPLLLRWNHYEHSAEWEKSFARKLLDPQWYENNVFILDDAAIHYNPPDDINVFHYEICYYDESDRVSYQIFDKNNKLVIATESIEEVLWFAVLVCKYLIVGSKGERFATIKGIQKSHKKELVEIFLAKGESHVMVLPGKSNSFGNQLLKVYDRNNIRFIDCWSDVIDLVRTHCGETDIDVDDDDDDKPF